MPLAPPETRYAKSGDVNIAYQVAKPSVSLGSRSGPVCTPERSSSPTGKLPGSRTGARVAGLAAPGEVLVSSTVKDLVAGSGIEFEDRGAHELKGVPGEWRLYAVSNA
jgi:class 3 adenylate cyclase